MFVPRQCPNSPETNFIQQLLTPLSRQWYCCFRKYFKPSFLRGLWQSYNDRREGTSGERISQRRSLCTVRRWPSSSWQRTVFQKSWDLGEAAWRSYNIHSVRLLHGIICTLLGLKPSFYVHAKYCQLSNPCSYACSKTRPDDLLLQKFHNGVPAFRSIQLRWNCNRLNTWHHWLSNFHDFLLCESPLTWANLILS